MRRAILSVVAYATATLAAGAGMAAAIAVLNPALTARDAAVVTFGMWCAFAVILAVPVLLCGALGRATAKEGQLPSVGMCTVVGLFILFWFARLEPAHQLLSVRPHLSRWGAAELLFITAWSVAAVIMASRGPRRFPTRVLAVLATLAAGSATMYVTARAIEPARRRDAEMSALALRFPAASGHASHSGRVLVIGIDGLEWRTLTRMIDQGRLPAMQRLLREGRFYQHDNRAMGYSSVIWTALYSGHPARDNAVGDFAKWQFTGARHPVVFLPRYGLHAMFFVDEFLRRVPADPLWTDEPVTTADSVYPPVWSIASHAGKRVGVFNPVPHVIAPERLHGFLGFSDDDGYSVLRDGATGTVHIPHNRERFREEFGADIEDATVAAKLFREEHPDLGIFYTHLVDSVSHDDWPFRLENPYFGGDPSPDLGARFDASTIRRAYDAADDMVATLAGAFGSDATIVLVSDHGWRYDDYEHFSSPFGVLMISPADQTGYGGIADVLGVAPTILSLLDVPADEAMAAAIPPYVAARTTERYVTTVQRTYGEREDRDGDRLQRLRALGYVVGPPKKKR